MSVVLSDKRRDKLRILKQRIIRFSLEWAAPRTLCGGPPWERAPPAPGFTHLLWGFGHDLSHARGPALTSFMAITWSRKESIISLSGSPQSVTHSYFRAYCLYAASVRDEGWEMQREVNHDENPWRLVPNP